MLIFLIFLTILISSILLFTGIKFMLELNFQKILFASIPILVVHIAFLFYQPKFIVLSNILVLATSIMVGSMFGRLVRVKMAIITFCITASIVDFISFGRGGLTDKIITSFEQGTNNLLSYLAITIPYKNGIQPVVGLGDLIILGILFFSLIKIGFKTTYAFLFPLSGLLIAVTIGLLKGGIYAIPFISGLTIIGLLIKGKHLS